MGAEVGSVADFARVLAPGSKVLCLRSSDLSDSESIMSGVIFDYFPFTHCPLLFASIT